jgi:alkanesulfonate monooxygenase SsuD/methylene tetrahydromethanopterin reductase-like flavin-dependent oxidoreductase (luciferase family)
VDDFESRMDPLAHAILEEALSCTVVGSPQTVRRGLADFVARTGADELMVTSAVFDHAARLRSFEIAAQAHAALAR